MPRSSSSPSSRLLLPLLLLGSACSGIAYHVDYVEEGYDFDQLSTFSVESPPNTDVTTLSSARVEDVAQRTLAARGYTLSVAPDFVLRITPESQALLSGWLVQRRKPQVKVTAEAFDPDKDRVFWRADAIVDREPHMLPADIERLIEELISSLLVQFPE